ncbi:ROK family protein [Actinoplanes sp. NPDC024001]|uniref:ROK family protein n=1 Tax=Actinoplanes sp. NPDC024001 TaxID=3154598 RepID=UPI0033C99681
MPVELFDAPRAGGHRLAHDLGVGDQSPVGCRPRRFCGRRGCLSTFMAPQRFGAVLEEHGPPTETTLRMAAAGRRPAQRALYDAGRMIGRAVAVLCDVLNPAVVVVVGGRFTEPGPYVVEGVTEALRRHGAPSAATGLTVARAELGADAETLGAIESLLVDR